MMTYLWLERIWTEEKIQEDSEVPKSKSCGVVCSVCFLSSSRIPRVPHSSVLRRVIVTERSNFSAYLMFLRHVVSVGNLSHYVISFNYGKIGSDTFHATVSTYMSGSCSALGKLEVSS